MLTLAAAITGFTGSPVALDARLGPECLTPPAIAWVAPGRSAVSVTCAAPKWRLFVPVSAPVAAPAPLMVRRGDIIAVVAGGPGFRVTVDAVVEADAVAGGRVRLRNRVTGERIVAMVLDGGEIVMPGFNLPDGGR